MQLAFIPLLTGLVPIVAVNVAYIIAAGLDHVPTCFVYLDGCTTISSTGRKAPESLWFRATLIPTAVLMLIYWRLIGDWIKCLDKRQLQGVWVLQWLGSLASVFLIVYTVALGFIDPNYHIQRRIGVTGFFSCTFLAQLLLARRLWYISLAQPELLSPRIAQAKITLCFFLLVVGLISIPVSAWIGGNEPENIVEWNFSLLMYCYFLLTYWGWRTTGFRATLEINIKNSSD
ncbi:MAG: hypothetical protein GXP08_15020 [Gammaproteobacteria bacterium]|nr:hypothetical protein [Gammaproteobacteria bacterium]